MPRNGAGVASPVPGFNTVAASNTILSAIHNSGINDIFTILNSAWPVSLGGTGGTTAITSWDAITAKGTDIASASTIVLTTATGPRIDITGTTAITAVTLANGSMRIARATGIFVLTASATLLVNKSASVNYTTAVGDLMIFTAEGGVTSVTVIGSSSSSNTTSNAAFINLSLVASVAASALTVAIKGVDGNDPSASNPVTISFRSATLTSGAVSQLTLTAALSIVASSGSTLGATSAVAATYALAVFNDAGTARMAIINPLTLPLVDGIASATSEGGAGAADSAGVWYSNAVITSKAYTIVGYITVTEATAGTWATAPSTTQVGPAPAVNNVLPGSRPGLALLTNGSASGATLDLVLTSYTGFRGILIELINLIPATNADGLLARVSSNGGSSYDAAAANYQYAGVFSNNTGQGNIISASATSITIEADTGNGAAQGVSAAVTILGQNNAAINPKIGWRSDYYDSSGRAGYSIGNGIRNAAQITNAIRFLFSTGNITSGTYAIYGYL